MGLAILARLFCWCEGICFWLDWRSELELRRRLMRSPERRPFGSQGKQGVPAPLFAGSLLGDGIGAPVATKEYFVRGDFLRDPWLRRGTRGGKRTGRRASDTRCSKRRGITAERRGEE